MANINLTFSLEKKHGLVLRITEQGQTNGSRVKVKNLVNPDFKTWNKKEQRFVDATEEAIHNNRLLQDMKQQYQFFLENGNPETPADLKNMVETGKMCKTEKKVTGFGDYIKELIYDMKHEKNRMPSKNYQNYITLLHKLETEGKIIDTPLQDVDDTHFIAFGKYILKQLNGKNYLGLMKMFHTTITKARTNKMTSKILDYPYRKDAPHDIEKARNKAKNGITTLSVKQYQKFVELDLLTIVDKRDLKYAEMYRDFCIFLYEMKMRPCDLIKLHNNDIDYPNNTLCYWATKKKNYTKQETAIVRPVLTKVAKKLIKKYAGQSTKGYIFPFAMNEYDWCFKDDVSFNKWYNRNQAQLYTINQFLKKVAKELKLGRLTIYTFRHSAFTHNILNGANLMKLAKEGGTSIEMFQRHYFNHLANHSSL